MSPHNMSGHTSSASARSDEGSDVGLTVKKDLSSQPCPFPRCHWGAACKYDHGEVQRKEEEKEEENTKWCGHFMKGKCFYGSECKFEHPTVDFKKKKKVTNVICRHYLVALTSGDKRGCTFGDNCRYLHQEELDSPRPEEELLLEAVGPPMESEENTERKKKKRRRKKRKKKRGDGDADDTFSCSSPPPLESSDSEILMSEHNYKQQMLRLEQQWLEYFPRDASDGMRKMDGQVKSDLANLKEILDV